MVALIGAICTADAADVYLADGDSLALYIDSVTGSPLNLGFTIFLDLIQ